jgi:hypothetical protein
MDNIGELVRESCVAFSEMRKNSKYLANDEYVVAVSESLYKTMYSQIHLHLAELRDGEGEPEIRKHIEYVIKFVLPTLRDKLKSVVNKANKIKSQKLTEESAETLQNLQDLYAKYGKIYDIASSKGWPKNSCPPPSITWYSQSGMISFASSDQEIGTVLSLSPWRSSMCPR